MNPESQFSLQCNTDNNLIYAHCLQSIIKFQFSFEIWTIQWLCLCHDVFQCCRSCGFSCNSWKLSWLTSRCRDKCKHIFSSYYHHQSCHCQQYSLKYLLHLTSLFIAPNIKLSEIRKCKRLTKMQLENAPLWLTKIFLILYIF